MLFLGSVVAILGLSSGGTQAEDLWFLGSVVVALGLRSCCLWAQLLFLGSAVEVPGLSSCGCISSGVVVPGFSSCYFWAQWLQHTGSGVVFPGLWSTC